MKNVGMTLNLTFINFLKSLTGAFLQRHGQILNLFSFGFPSLSMTPAEQRLSRRLCSSWELITCCQVMSNSLWSLLISPWYWRELSACSAFSSSNITSSAAFLFLFEEGFSNIAALPFSSIKHERGRDYYPPKYDILRCNRPFYLLPRHVIHQNTMSESLYHIYILRKTHKERHHFTQC